MLLVKGADLSGIRWNAGERLDHLFEGCCDRLEKDGKADHPAVIVDGVSCSFRQLDEHANRFARHLAGQGVSPGDRIGLLLDRSLGMYAALLAVLKVNAAYVPLDPSFPPERLSFILHDAGAKLVVTTTALSPALAGVGLPQILMDVAAAEISTQSPQRLSESEKRSAEEQLAYIIYTSGTTGNPKGVAVEHASICNFVKVAAETYGYTDQDRVYQGLTIAFDFSVEEIWVPLVVGATLVPGKPESSLVGADLHSFLRENRISALCCVPTLLATIEEDLPDLRFLLVSGESCPQELVTRWHREGRTILNAYGPTEATVTATVTRLLPNNPVTIGKPLPTYTVVLLDEQNEALAPDGESGEIGIAGIGLAKGYLNREELTRQKFIPDFVGLPDNPSKRIYRTGDLGRFTADGDIEYLGRIDTQVKIRGYRVELTEIEALLLRNPLVAQAVVATFEPEPGVKELVAYYSLKSGASELDRGQLVATMREKLPAYMVPAYFEQLDIIPMTSSHKADRKNLPAPKGPRFTVTASGHVSPRTPREQVVASVLEATLKIEAVSIKSNFFSDLGAHSLLMAQFCASLRRRVPGLSVSIREVYRNPTIETFAAHLDYNSVEAPIERTRPPRHASGNFEYFGCAVLQLGTYVALGLFGLWLLLIGFHWTYAAIADPAYMYLRILAYFGSCFLGLSALSVAAKWLLIGRWKAETIPLWSPRYFQFWLVKLLIANSPMATFIGGPLYNVYLRLLGARIGKHAVIRSSAPICTDLFFVGDGALIRDGTLMPGYCARDNYIYVGGIEIGSNAFIGSASVLDINTAVGDAGQLGHSSTLQEGQRVAAGKCMHGTPAEPTQANYRTVEPMRCSSLRRWLYPLALFGIALALSPLPIFALYFGFPYLYRFAEADRLNYSAPLQVLVDLAPHAAAISTAVFIAFALLSLVGIRLIPLLIRPFLQEGRTYVLFGMHYFLHNVVSFVSNSGWMNAVFGDSSNIVPYLKWAGFRFDKVVQTGSNFGLDQVHDNPFLCSIGTGSMVSDGLAFANMELSNSSFRLGRISVGANTYLGNNIFWPANAKLGANVLVGTKAMIPLDGAVRENTGLLGSPCFEVPRATARDIRLIEALGDKRGELLQRKRRWNVVTMLSYLFRDLFLFFAASLFLFEAVLYYPIYGAVPLMIYVFGFPLFAIAVWIVVERASLGFGRLQARVVDMYDPYFLFHERHWKLCVHPVSTLFNGTPMKSLVTRALGVKVGRRVFDDGANIYDKTLVELGDEANLNQGCVLQGHSLEEGAFKSDYVIIGPGCTIGSAAFVHYGVVIEANAVLGPNALLMKGETIPKGASWEGNPARTAIADLRSRGVELRAA